MRDYFKRTMTGLLAWSMLAPAPGFGQTSATLTRGEMETRASSIYRQYVQTTLLEMEENFAHPLNRNTEFEGERYLDVDPCSDEYADIAEPEAPGEQATSAQRMAFGDLLLMRPARYFTSIRESLRRGGYPVAAFEPLLARDEQRGIGSAIRVALGEPDPPETEEDMERNQFTLADILEPVRARVAPNLPPIKAITGCGGAESPTFIRSTPAGAQVWVITAFRFMHCRALNLDPWNTDRCRHWVQVQPQQTHNVVGRFLYMARWSDGRTANGRGMITPRSDQSEQYFNVVPGRMP